jgi:predicted Zn-dependent protease with MMP-like domain
MSRDNQESGLDRFRAIALESYGSIPAKLRRHVDDVVIRVDEWPDRNTLDEMGCETRWDLLGLYRGVPIGNQSPASPRASVDMIFLYRQPIIAYARATQAPLDAVIRNVLIHEIGHHFGFSDADMHRIESED